MAKKEKKESKKEKKEVTYRFDVGGKMVDAKNAKEAIKKVK